MACTTQQASYYATEGMLEILIANANIDANIDVLSCTCTCASLNV